MAAASEYVLEPIRETAEYTLYRARQNGTSSSVLVVAPTAEQPLPQSLRCLEHEYSLAAELELAWAAKPLALTRHEGRAILVLADPGGEPLDLVLERDKDQPLDLARLLRIAIDLAIALGHAHQRGLIHKNVKPENVLVALESKGDGGNVWLTGFGIASRLRRERQSHAPPEIIAGTLAYMSPEQTGRMNRSIDTRSDLYSLGVTLYQILTGVLPFAAADPLEWVHCHIARQPVAPIDRRTVPEALSAIIMKLLAKNAEERYQTAAGVEGDLRRCLSEWQSHRRIDPFPLAANDASDRLLIPEKLYGREREVDTLLAAFDRVVTKGAAELVLVSGYSGVGKSSVVNELHKVLVPPRGLFATGKFDQYKREVPYATLAQAFQVLVRQILVKNQAEVNHWRSALLDALGTNGQLMVNLIPELEFVIGKQSPVVELPPQEARGRFQLVFRRFLGAFARPEHPLALFLDDLQWLDTATLELLERLVTDSDVRHVLLIGAYRDNEVNTSHPLIRTLAAIRGAGARPQEIVLAPLGLDDVERLIADALHCEPSSAGPLTLLVHEKTGGNPFFAIQFITELEEEGLLRFDRVAGTWNWDLDRIRGKRYSGNVVDLMVGKLIRLPKATQESLKQLACLGDSATFELLRTVYGDSKEDMHERLWEAVRAGLIFRTENSYRFLHDRVQEAAYSLIPRHERAQTHLRIGRILMKSTRRERLEEAIFDIVNQVNRGSDLITDAAEREQAAGLNLIAGKRGKASTAYAAALKYLHAGRSLLSEADWERNYDLIFSIESLLAECELLTADMAAAEGRLTRLAQHSRRRHDFAVVTRLQVTLYTTSDRSDRAIEVFLDYLRSTGTDWSPHPARDDVNEEYNRIWSLVGNRKIEDLVDLPLLDDPDILDMLDVFTEIVHPAIFFDENLSTLVVCRMLNLCLEYGTSDASCFGYVWFGMFAGPRFNNYKDGFRFGQLGYDLIAKRNLTRYEARTYTSFGTLTPWGKPALKGRELIRRAFDVAYRTGDLTFSAYSWHSLIANYLLVGDPLPEVQSEAEKGLSFVEKAGFGLVTENCRAILGLIRTLRGLAPTFGCFDAQDYNESEAEQRFAGNRMLSLSEFFYWTRKLQARFFAGDYTSAVEASRKAHQLLWTAASQVETADFRFYAALAHAAAWNSASPEERQMHFAAVTDHHQQLETWALHCPANFEAKTTLVNAEIARMKGRMLEAEHFYEAAIRSARDNSFVHCEAVSHECAAEFYSARDLTRVAQVYFRDARDCYLRWGADAKVRQIEERHPKIKAEKTSRNDTILATVEQLDLATVMRVSEAVSGEIEQEKLIDKLMRTAIENAGADRGLLIRVRDGEPRIEAEATAGRGGIEVVARQVAITPSDLPQSTLQYVIRTKEGVLLDDASVDSVFSGDEYVRKRSSKSILCLPIVKGAKLVGALYLENSLTPGAFTPNRVTVLRLLASQAAISLENATLYYDLQLQAGLLQNLPVSAWALNPDGTADFVNQVWLEYSGQTLEFVRSHPEAWMTAVHPEDREAAARIFWAGIRTGQGFAMETRALRAQDGTYRWHLNQAVVLRDAEGKVLKFVGTTTDIDDQKRAEEDLRANELRLREMTETIPEMLWSATPEGAIDYCNARFLEYTGLAAEEVMGEGWQKTIHPDDTGRAVPAWMSSVKTGAPYRVEVRTFHAADRTYRWCLVSALPLLDQQRRILKWHGTIADMHDWKRAEEKIRRSEKEARQLLDLSPLHITEFGPEGARLYTNRASLDDYGITLDQWRNADLRNVLHPQDAELLVKELPEKFQKGLPFEYEARVKRKDGEYRWFHYRLSPMSDEEGRTTRWYAAGTDIDDRKLAEQKLQEENVALREEIDKASMFEEIVGTSAPLKKVLSRISKVAPTDSSVLVTGETGTGKELVARAIHRRSRRSSHAFVSVNCAAIPRDLIASELFGHEKGAFTGATERRVGRFELAEKGTIFLDEVGELPEETQIALLRVLQEREFERVGGTGIIRTDVRVIAATNRDLESAIESRRFRTDLFYRLNVFPIEVPPLRKRSEDIPLLVTYFLNRYARKAGRHFTALNKKSLDLLQSYAWPGNIRELQNVIERSVIVSESQTFSVDESWLSPRSSASETNVQPSLFHRPPAEEKAAIEAALRECGGRVYGPSGAAVKLGIPRTTLESKIRSLNINKNRFKQPGPLSDR
jgi:PAS domain S-box-containing protein